ncbi:hypothetical protein BDF20DRAFT_867790 [Mycotypha africana]|uniref:uncharacterized protein n=1 Tax=Mycotypha africana TaxID=64632 RepID=UPI0023019C70|nr:uncharacterized protein BDF20DRAFT_867790 [Mycotypha africana]KAI8979130.1 hypothetical protein BDF20DRAFT_867790 [Mycotypha africana]
MTELARGQINSLLSENPSTITVVDGHLYEVPIAPTQQQQQSEGSLIINLPSNFPEEPPVITVSPTGMRHPWIDSDVVMHDGLPSWTLQSNLGLLVKDICKEFTMRPPAKKSTTVTGGTRISVVPPPLPASQLQQQQVTSMTNKTNDEGYGARPQPPIPSRSNSSNTPTSHTTNLEYNAISKLSSEEIDELLSDETGFEIFFNTLDRVKNLKAFQEELRNGNDQLAHKNLSREDQLIKLRSEVADLYNKYQTDKAAFDKKERQQNEAFSRFSSSTVLTRLKASLYESDELSESVAQSFLDGNLDNDSFVKQFREFRKVYHLRASKLERAQKDNLFVSY